MGDRPQTPFGSAPFLPLWGSPPFTLLPWPSSSSSSSLLAHHLQIGRLGAKGGRAISHLLFGPPASRSSSLSASGPGPSPGRRIFHLPGLGWLEGCGAFLPSQGGGGGFLRPLGGAGASPRPWAGWSVGCPGRWREATAGAGRQAGHCWQSASAAGAGGKEGCPCCAGQFPGQGAGRSRPGPAGQSAVGAVSGDGGLRRARCRPSCCGSRWPAWRHSSGRR